MLRPERMSLVNMAFLKDDLEKVFRLLIEKGEAEIENADKFITSKEKLRKIDMAKNVEETKSVLAQIENLSRKLKVKKISEPRIALEIDLEIGAKIGARLRELEEEVTPLLQKLGSYEKEIEILEYKSRALSHLEDMGIYPWDLRDLPHLESKIGIIPSPQIRKIQDFLIQIPLSYKICEYYRGQAILFILTLKEYAQKFDSLLKGIGFQSMEISNFNAGNLGELLEEIEFSLWQKREEIALAKERIEKIRKEQALNLSRWHWLLENNLKIFEAMNKFLESQFGYLISFWMPSRKFRFLKSNLEKTLKDEIQIYEEKAETLIEKKQVVFQEIPSSLRHPLLLKPFRRLLTLYGWPAYLHIDPTLFMALSFVTMFGIMFGDLGHGIILFALGIVPFLQKKLKFLREVGALFVYTGLSSSLFGILFGSVFGKEDIIQALWFRPMEKPIQFLLLGIILGITFISLGIILNLIQHLWQKKYRQFLFSQWGFFSLVFYWLSLYLVVAGLRYKTFKFSLPLLTLIVGLPLLLIMVGDMIFSKKSEEKDFSESIAKPMEIMLGLLTNTISYIRVAAFGLTHLALMSSVYLVADTLGGIRGFRESIILEGNLGVIILEGLIVFIQCLRLEYYEFFSKFFILEGRRFNPLRISGT